MKKFLLIPVILLLLACEVAPRVEYIPTTPEERAAVQATVDAQLARSFPNGLTLSGHDQDWDDLVQRMNIEVRYNLCRPTQWEYQGSFDGAMKTGRWRYLGEATWRSEALK